MAKQTQKFDLGGAQIVTWHGRKNGSMFFRSKYYGVGSDQTVGKDAMIADGVGAGLNDVEIPMVLRLSGVLLDTTFGWDEMPRENQNIPEGTGPKGKMIFDKEFRQDVQNITQTVKVGGNTIVGKDIFSKEFRQDIQDVKNGGTLPKA